MKVTFCVRLDVEMPENMTPEEFWCGVLEGIPRPWFDKDDGDVGQWIRETTILADESRRVEVFSTLLTVATRAADHLAEMAHPLDLLASLRSAIAFAEAEIIAVGGEEPVDIGTATYVATVDVGQEEIAVYRTRGYLIGVDAAAIAADECETIHNPITGQIVRLTGD